MRPMKRASRPDIPAKSVSDLEKKHRRKRELETRAPGRMNGLMSASDLTADSDYQHLLGRISDAYASGQVQAVKAVNSVITETYWQIGRDIVEFEQEGKARAAYGKGLLDRLSRDLTLRHGKGFSRSNMKRFRQFYL